MLPFLVVVKLPIIARSIDVACLATRKSNQCTCRGGGLSSIRYFCRLLLPKEGIETKAPPSRHGSRESEWLPFSVGTMHRQRLNSTFPRRIGGSFSVELLRDVTSLLLWGTHVLLCAQQQGSPSSPLCGPPAHTNGALHCRYDKTQCFSFGGRKVKHKTRVTPNTGSLLGLGETDSTRGSANFDHRWRYAEQKLSRPCFSQKCHNLLFTAREHVRNRLRDLLKLRPSPPPLTPSRQNGSSSRGADVDRKRIRTNSVDT